MLEAFLSAPFYVTCEPAELHLPVLGDTGQVQRAGPWQATDRGQQHRYTGHHHRRNVPRSLEEGKAPAKLGRPWAEAKWSESRLGCLVGWLQAS